MSLGCSAHIIAICCYDHPIIQTYHDCLDLKRSPDKRLNGIRLTPHTLTNRLRLIGPDQIARKLFVCEVGINHVSNLATLLDVAVILI